MIMIHTTKGQLITLALITLITLALTMISTPSGPDCTNPSTWATESGVQHCAINGGK